MNNAAELIIYYPTLLEEYENVKRQPTATEVLSSAEKSVNQALSHQSSDDLPLCRSVLCAIKYNKAMVLEVSSNSFDHFINAVSLISF